MALAALSDRLALVGVLSVHRAVCGRGQASECHGGAWTMGPLVLHNWAPWRWVIPQCVMRAGLCAPQPVYVRHVHFTHDLTMRHACAGQARVMCGPSVYSPRASERVHVWFMEGGKYTRRWAKKARSREQAVLE